MHTYRETLWPSVWIYIALLLLIPACILVLTPVSLPAGIVTGILLYIFAAGALTLTAPRVKITDSQLHAGRATIELSYVSEAQPLNKDQTREALGTELDVRAYLVTRGWLQNAVQISIMDATDPTPYWLVSSRRPKQLSTTINEIVSKL